MSTTTAPVLPDAQRPRLAPGIEVHPPMGDGGSWVIQHGPRYIRVSASVASLAQRLDGETTIDALAGSMGVPWTAELVTDAVGRFDALRLLDRGEQTPKKKQRSSRIKLVPPFTVQLTLLSPGRTMQALQPALARWKGRRLAATSVVTALAGLVVLAVQAPYVTNLVSQPLSPLAYVGLLVGLIAGTSLHELGHAFTLIRYGGRPSRIGIMLFYLMPTFFCDVSDSWRLAERCQRVHVALAGPAVQTFLAGASALAAWPLDVGGVKTCLVLFAVGSYITGLLNLLPLIKLDGYIALMSRVDIPYLRDRAIKDARRSVARLLFGGTYRRELPGRSWTVWYGLACMTFPLYLLSTALKLWIGLLQRAGFVGACLAASAFCYVLYLVGRGIRRLVGEVRGSGASRVRVTLVGALLAAAASAVAFLPVTCTTPAAYVTRAGGVDVVLMRGSDASRIEPGRPVSLSTNGLILTPSTGHGVIGQQGGKRTTAPVSAFFPIALGPEPETPVISYRLTTSQAPTEPFGTAEVDTGRLPLWEVAYRTYVAPFIP
ncbi:daptide biosynthesis intramembrane metalloprotease [Streptomyces sp. Rer75]|uniref:daptide biosynthesis intramembrane metalloprotease n=1 Tax=Streptomyces sp. Rer75 TaxID=2750011 RepID=UPI0027B9E85A|nr:daptide biosynthesis intramembrane metalloprotease [Streptomyces sp. Rer75]